MKKLKDLLPIESDVAIESIYSDSRIVKPNSIFFCLDGLSVDGHQFIEEAIYKGATCIVHSKPLTTYHENVIYYHTDNVLTCLSHVASVFYNDPSHILKMIGVTGTNGKTIVSSLIYHALNQKISLGYIGTRHLVYKENVVNYRYTTPELVLIQEYLDKMVNENIVGTCLEVSSHGLALERVLGVKFDIAIFTNLSEDHLDFHGSMDNYIQTKLKLLHLLKEKAVIIVNRDDETLYHKVLSSTKAKLHTFSINQDATIRAIDIKLGLQGTSFKVLYNQQEYPLHTHLLGMVNVYHIIAAILAILQFNISIEQAIKLIETIQAVDGRFQLVDNQYNLNIMIDNAYTLKHYEEVFSYASKVVNGGRIIAVFGCVGKREVKKRLKIGELADRYCDHIILTEEDCKDEDPEKICEDIQKGIKHATCVTVIDREMAIYQAIEMATPSDIILILGKGEDKTIIRKDGLEEYMGDYEAAKNAICQIYCDDFSEY